ncbi:MAG: polysaccharide biosynthesis tyrosine autokinase [Flavobacteriaceae bacterium]
MNNNLANKLEEHSIKDLIFPYTRKWIWFLLGLIIAIILAFIYLRYTMPQYESKSVIVINEGSENNFSADLAPFSKLGIFKKFNKGKLENEIAILKSRQIISKVIDKLSLNTKYEVEGRVITSEQYPSSPIKVDFIKYKDSLNNGIDNQEIRFKIISENQFELLDHYEGLGISNFNENILLDDNYINISVNNNFKNDGKSYLGKTFIVTYTKTIDLALGYQKALEIFNSVDNSNIVTISLKSFGIKKSENFINELISQYNFDAIEDQNLIAKKTADFIAERIKIITLELDSVESNKEVFKTNNKLTNIDSEAQLMLETATEFNNKQIEVAAQIEIIESVLNYIKNDNEIHLLPTNNGIENNELSSGIENYNKLVLERNRLLINSTTQNPVIVNIEAQINDLKNSVLESLIKKRDALNITLREINIQEKKFNSRLSKIPAQEKIFRDIVRQQEIKEQLYIYLLKQREEASIKLSATSLKAKVIDTAFTSKTPIAPKKDIIILGAALMGVLIPFLIIYIRILLNTKVENRRDVENILKDFSLVGEIPKMKGDVDQVIKANDRSVLAESFRILRTNLEYFLLNKKIEDNSKSIFVTSTIKGEGKTLIAFNIALSLSHAGKKVALVGADIRNPQLQRYLSEDQRKHKGLTEYIVNDSLTLDEVIVPTKFTNIDLVLSGAIPPNPAELLLQKRVDLFFKELKKEYDYIIVDTAPSMLVTDTLLISKYADVTIYVIKADYTDKKLLEFPKEAVNDGKLSNVALVLNNVGVNNFGYGNKYGYAYSNEKPSLKERLFG